VGGGIAAHCEAGSIEVSCTEYTRTDALAEVTDRCEWRHVDIVGWNHRCISVAFRTAIEICWTHVVLWFELITLRSFVELQIEMLSPSRRLRTFSLYELLRNVLFMICHIPQK